MRRLRPNIVIDGVDGMAEREWEDGGLVIGDAVVYLDSLRARCPMTTVDPDTLVRDPAVLKDIGRRFGGRTCQGDGQKEGRPHGIAEVHQPKLPGWSPLEKPPPATDSAPHPAGPFALGPQDSRQSTPATLTP